MTFRSVALALVASSILPVAAHAAVAFASKDVRVHAGPGTDFRTVGRLHDGDRVDVSRCTTGYSWCEISHRGTDGWVAAQYLYDRRYGKRRPLNHFGFRLDIPALDFKFGVGPKGPEQSQRRHRMGPDRGVPHDGRGADRHGRNGDARRRSPVARVCFYTDANFRGDSFCVRAGENDRRLGRHWNDRISSIRVTGDVRVRVCENFNYRGRCHVVTRDRPRLGRRDNDMISSYRVM